MVLVLVVALALPLAASAGRNGSSGSGSSRATGGEQPVVPDPLLATAKENPKAVFRVIVQGESDQSAGEVAQDVADVSVASDAGLSGAVKSADAVARKAHDAWGRALDRASTARKLADEASRKGERDAAKRLADAAKAAQEAAWARNAVGVADGNAEQARDDVVQARHAILEERITGRFDAISGVAAGLTGAQITALAATGGDVASITPDVPVVATAEKWSNAQTWIRAAGVDAAWADARDPAIEARTPAIAIVDSGIEDRADFQGRLVASVNLSRLPGNSPGDGRGHGTFVAGIAAGAGERYPGTAPWAKLVSIDVLDDNGMGLTSDVIGAAQWILDNKDRYGIRVANFSLHSEISTPFYLDPLDRAVERLWFNGVVVVTAVGNYGTDGSPSGVLYSPADDPFVITVGAADVGRSADTWDDAVAPWSAWGSTLDGFMKPDLSAPGRYMVGPAPTGSTLSTERPDSVVAPGYMQLSGTSFAAPVVSGTVAIMLARNPELTPDQVKGALMVTARPFKKAVGGAGGAGEISIDRAIEVDNPPNPNAGLSRFLVSTGGTVAFDAFSWRRAARGSASWNSASWNSASWNSASWNSASWNSASWNSASWNSASWNSASWNSASWNSGSREDAVDRDEPLH